MADWEAKLDRVIAQRFSAYFMSDAKWRRFFTVLNLPDLGIRQGLWKFVDLEAPFRYPFPDAAEIESGWILEPAGESPFKRIEWVEISLVEIPSRWDKIPQKHKAQNVEAAVAALNDAGQFELERTETGVRAYGYR